MPEQARQGFWASINDVGSLIALLWLVELVDVVLRGVLGLTLDGLGVWPREPLALGGILIAPFLHGDWNHLLANSFSLLILGTLSMWYSRRQFWWAVGWAVVVGGSFTWLVAPADAPHIGASGVCFGLLGLLLANGIFRRHFWAIVLAIVVGLVFGGTLYLALPSAETAARQISWQMHLGGFIGGSLASWRSRDQRLTRVMRKP